MTFEFENVRKETIYTNHGMSWGSEWLGKVKVNGIDFKFSIHNDSGTGRLSEKNGLIHKSGSFFASNEISFRIDEKYTNNPKLAIKQAFENNETVKEYFQKATAEKIKNLLNGAVFENVMKDSTNLD